MMVDQKKFTMDVGRSLLWMMDEVDDGWWMKFIMYDSWSFILDDV